MRRSHTPARWPNPLLRSNAHSQVPCVATPRTGDQRSVARRLEGDWLMDIEISLEGLADEAPHGLPMRTALWMYDQIRGVLS